MDKRISIMGTDAQIKSEARKIAEIAGVDPVVDYLLEWANECFHQEVLNGMQDKAADIQYAVTGIPQRGYNS